MPTETQVKAVFQYHLATKHHFHRYAPGPGRLDWANQPDPFRRYQGVPLIELDFIEPTDQPAPPSTPAALNLRLISQLFYDSLAVSAWKEAGGERWALRVNPSSGNLHPTEAYLFSGAISGLAEQPALYHYASREHALELRAHIDERIWAQLAGTNADTIFYVALSSIIWREAWKYGERAFRYCNHDVGHASAALRIAAAGLGWCARLVEEISTQKLAVLMGLNHPPAVEPEHPDCLIVFYPTVPVGQEGPWTAAVCKAPAAALPQATGARLKREESAALAPQHSGAAASALHTAAVCSVGAISDMVLDAELVSHFEQLHWLGQPNQLSADVVEWPWITKVVAAVQKPDLLKESSGWVAPVIGGKAVPNERVYPRKLIRQRRSAVAMDGVTPVPRDTFYSMLMATLPIRPPFDLWPWKPAVHLALFVHRVEELSRGLYFLSRNSSHLEQLKGLLNPDFAWAHPPGCPEQLPLFLLQEADCREAAMMVSCHQDIAAEGCFSLGMIAEFDRPIREHGAWFYPRLFWECGLVGQVLYLEAERVGLRGTGIGCFFDEPMHQLLGLKSMTYQSLYHFTIGGPVEDKRIISLPAEWAKIGPSMS